MTRYDIRKISDTRYELYEIKDGVSTLKADASDREILEDLKEHLENHGRILG